MLKFSIKYRDKIRGGAKVMLDLRSDSTFQIGYCDNKVAYEGRWQQKQDTLALTKIYQYSHKRYLEDQLLKLDLENGYIFYPQYLKRKGSNEQFKRYVTVLKIGGTGFDGELDQGYR